MAQLTAITNARLVLERQIIVNASLLIANGEIVSFGSAQDIKIPENTKVIDAKNAYLGPGFVDIHNHCGGWRFEPEEVMQHAKYYLARGTTSLLPTFFYQMSREQVFDGLSNMRALMNSGGSTICGINFEGPYLNRDYGFAGELVWDIDKKEYEKMIKLGEGVIKIWCVAPEREGIEEFVRAASEIKPVFSAAHTEATSEQLYALVPYGLKLATHHLNATGCAGGRGRGIRNVGVDEAVQLHDGICIELIADSMAFHVSPLYLQLAYKIKGPDKTVLITDSTEFVDADDVAPTKGDLRFGTNGDLMGSAMTMDGALRNMMTHAGVSLCEAWKMSSTTPAKLIGLTRRGQIEKGAIADLVMLNDALKVENVLLNGELVVF